ncbi:MAG: flagellar basal-body rod protein FlgF [Proteobacteria bacterium]|nr:flagellar basal-body rod protein FlgF [Pseudomonadota bacterium]MDE3208616.1 flagellar basal-body rod protein FlgF [Pseudomonadota bacterium]
MGLLYVVMSGANHVELAQEMVANNLANVNTTGFRADQEVFSSYMPPGGGHSASAYVVNSSTASNLSSGTISYTGNPLDIAVTGPGFFVVKDQAGKEAYTRDGNLMIGKGGILETKEGNEVVSDTGTPITIPPATKITIASDGTVSGVPTPFGQTLNSVNELGRIRLVNPRASQISKGANGLFYTKNGKRLVVDDNVKIKGGALEGSNVNLVDEMTQMISLSRQFDMDMQLIKTTQNNGTSADQILVLA